jgi:hypothetical protein
MNIRQAVKQHARVLLTRIGANLSIGHIHAVNAAVNYLEVGRWLKANGFDSRTRYKTRTELHSALIASIADRQVLYLEFGVFEGASLRQWVAMLRNPASSLHGFDSFEGLPDDWDSLRKRGEFNLDGRMPVFDDRRVVLHKGWFDETLPGFELPPHEQLVIHLDADLHSSTDYVLKVLEPRIMVGTILIFDEFCDRFHEMLAYEQHMERTKYRYAFLGGTEHLEQCAFRRVG